MAQRVKRDALTMFDICGNAIDQELNSSITQDGRVILLGDRTQTLWMLIQFMELVLKTRLNAFDIEKKRGESLQVKEASRLAHFFKGFYNLRELYTQNVQYSPDLELFFSCINHHGMQHCRCQNPTDGFIQDVPEAEVFNDFIQYLRNKAVERGTRKKMADWSRNPNKNLVSMQQYTDALFERYARLIVVRVDCLYRETCLESEDAIRLASDALMQEKYSRGENYFQKRNKKQIENMARIDVVTAKVDMNNFLRSAKKNPVFDEMVGYVWKLEWSQWSGYHYHCVFFFDGSKVQSDYALAKKIGEHWNDVTEARGFIHNCNQDPRQYRSWGIGRVDHHDDKKRADLHKALSYLAKRDQYVRVKPTANHRVFQTAVLKKRDGAAGRPRRKSSKKVNE